MDAIVRETSVEAAPVTCRAITSGLAYRSRRGQSILIAIAVMFILSFLGALFITIVAQTIQQTRRHNDTANFTTFAQAGVDFANNMLTTSVLGADWRPPLTHQVQAAPISNQGTATPPAGCPYDSIQQCDVYNSLITANQLAPVNSPTATSNLADPDAKYLGEGFTRYNIPGGRFLLRLTYMDNPLSELPTGFSKYIKIESVGLEGNVNTDDPTTYTAAGPGGPNRRAVIVAYKPIGLPDYSVFITNKNHLSGPAMIGVQSIYNSAAASLQTPGVFDFTGPPTASPDTRFPVEEPILTTIGNPTAYADPASGLAIAGGGGLRSNVDLQIHGEVTTYLDNIGHDEQWEVAGLITFDGFDPTTTTGPIPLTQQPGQLVVNGTNMAPSNGAPTDPYDTLGGKVRDGSTSTDVKGLPRDITYLSAPSLDVVDPHTNLTRYAELTQTGTPNPTSSGQPAAGPYRTGAPSTVYVDNAADVQAESAQQTLREDWLNPQPSTLSSNWKGDFYDPPGAQIVFGRVPGLNMWGFTVTRSDHGLNGTPTWTWYTPSGAVQSVSANRMRFVYAPQPASPPAFNPADPVYYLNADNGISPFVSNSGNSQMGVVNPNNDIVIYAQGNVRVRGTISDPNPFNSGSDPDGGQPGAYIDHHVTLVTNGIAYIDGSILKGGYISDNGAGGPPIAQQPYAPGAANQSYSNSSIAVLAKSYVTVNTTQFFAGPEDYSQNLSNPNTPVSGATSAGNAYDIGTGQSLTEAFTLPIFYTNGTSSAEQLFISESGDGDTAYGLIAAAFDGNIPATIYSNTAAPSGSLFNHVVPLNLHPFNTPTDPDPSMQAGLLTFQADQTQSAKDWLLHRVALLPADIRIEANLFSENNSFFVIPGPWFNDNPTDTMDKIATRGIGTTDADYPLYGQPVDLQITIFGSVSENMPADIGDQTAWMTKWGWIPKYYGSSASPTAHQPPAGQNLGIGLNFQYDPSEGYPYHLYKNNQLKFARVDAFGRALPFAPNLPVSPDLIYSGEESEQNYQL